ncbi:MAG: hypothetical protein ACREUB_12315 [Burkholderiales bacterium]
MPHRFGHALAAIALTAAALQPLLCGAQARLSPEHGGLGLRQQTAAGTDAVFGGARELTRSGLGAAETYGGVAFALSRAWGSSLEAAYAPESPLTPRQYALAGEVRTALGDRKALSVGIKYRVYDTDPGVPGEGVPANGYTLAPSRVPGTGYPPGYQVRFGYQHSPFTLFGLAVSRDLETYAAAFDPASPYPLQLSFTGQHWLSPSWALSYDVLSADLGGPSPLRRQGLGLRFGMRYRF